MNTLNNVGYTIGQLIGVLLWLLIAYGIYWITHRRHFRPRRADGTFVRRADATFMDHVRGHGLLAVLLVKLIKVLALGLWALVWAPAVALLWVVRRFDEVPLRRAAWQREHAAECRGLARDYRRIATRQLTVAFVIPETLALYAAHAHQLDRLADAFEADASDDMAYADEVDAAWRDSAVPVASRPGID